MTEKEKAQEIVCKFLNYVDRNSYTELSGIENAKECALFFVDEMLLQFTWRPKTGQSYWEEVKKEINNL